jgi:hypothetical protein
MKRLLLSFSRILLLLFFISYNTFSQTTYTWEGSESNSWSAAANWSPVRSSPQVNDILTFNGGGSVVVVNVPTETLRTISVTNNTSLDLQSSGGVTLSITTLLEVQSGSFIAFSSNGNAINVTIFGASNIKGSVTMHRGTFHVTGSLTLDGALTRGGGQYSLATTSSLNLGSGTGSSPVQIPNNLFIASPTIANLTVNNTAGANLGNQSITVTSSLNLIAGVLNTNASGRLILNSGVASPIETDGKYVQGYVQLQPTAVGTGSLSFMGLNIASGVDNIGNVSVLRRTGATAINSYNGRESLATTWEINAGSQPVSGRNLSLSWVSANDNSHNAALRFQVYRYGSGPSWDAVGALAPLASNVNGRRTTATVTTTEFSDWTASDENSPLPVTWMGFNGVARNETISLQWQTATEENADFFEVEKMHTENKFLSIGRLAAAGNSRTVKSYEFEDREPIVGINYYRIKQVDLDGQSSYSKIISVAGNSLTKQPYAVFPIPAENFIHVKRNGAYDDHEIVTLYDQFGNVKHTQQWGDEETITVDNLQLPAGMYRLVISNSKATHQRKVIIR